jgi:hypothetical protein
MFNGRIRDFRLSCYFIAAKVGNLLDYTNILRQNPFIITDDPEFNKILMWGVRKNSITLHDD